MIQRRPTENPELPAAPMLDMAFNLLTFFIFTFQPAPQELQFNLNLLPASPAAQPEQSPPTDAPAEEPTPIDSLSTTLMSDGVTGELRSIRLEEAEFDTLAQFEQRLQSILANEELGFKQAEIRVDPDLHYQYLIEVINIFAKNKLTRISFTQAR